MKCLKITKVYKTPSDGGINTKVGLYGYFKNKRGVTTPAPLVGNVFEHGTSTVKKHPFMRKSFRKAEIESEMKKFKKNIYQRSNYGKWNKKDFKFRYPSCTSKV